MSFLNRQQYNVMTTTNNIPHGYKESALGIIPSDWEVKRLGESYVVQGGFAFKSELFSEEGTPIIRISNLPQDKAYVDISDCVYYPQNENIKGQFIVNNGALLIAMSGATTGKTAIYNDDKIAYLNQRVGIFKQKNKTLVYEYMIRLINSDYFKRQLIPLLIAGAQPNIAPHDIERMKFPLPPLSEQKKIAEVLGVWDMAIEKQTRLIEQLEWRKKGLMQQLLTGKKRLPGFSEKWKEVKLGKYFSQITDVNDGRDYIPMTISAKLGLVSQTDKFDRVIAGESLKKYTLLHKGDFAYNKGNSNLYEMGCIYRLREKSAIVPFVYICFRGDKNVNGEFYQQYFINHGLDRQLKKVITSGARGDGLLNVNKKDFFNVVIPYPSLAEQTAIAEILTSADNEIAHHRQKLEQLRTQKRGLMQQLLTGKKRVTLNY